MEVIKKVIVDFVSDPVYILKLLISLVDIAAIITGIFAFVAYKKQSGNFTIVRDLQKQVRQLGLNDVKFGEQPTVLESIFLRVKNLSRDFRQRNKSLFYCLFFLILAIILRVILYKIVWLWFPSAPSIETDPTKGEYIELEYSKVLMYIWEWLKSLII